MGMFDKDKEIGTRIDDVFPLDSSGETESRQFVLWSAAVDAEKVETDLGEATKTRMVVSEIGNDSEEERQEVTTLASAIGDKASDAEPGDFPAVVKLMKVSSKKYGGTALVLQFVKQYTARTTTQRMNDDLDKIATPVADTPSPATAGKRK